MSTEEDEKKQAEIELQAQIDNQNRQRAEEEEEFRRRERLKKGAGGGGSRGDGSAQNTEELANTQTIEPPTPEAPRPDSPALDNNIDQKHQKELAPAPKRKKVDILGFPEPILKKLGIDAKPKGVAPTKQEQDMMATLLEKAPKTGFTPKLLHDIQNSLDKLNTWSEENKLSEDQQKDLSEFLKIDPKSPKPEFNEEEQNKFDEWCENNKITSKQKKELEDILIVNPEPEKPKPKEEPEINPDLPQPKFSNDKEKEKYNSLKDKNQIKFDHKDNFDKLALRIAMLSDDHMGELLNKNDEVDKVLEVLFQENEKYLFGVDTPIETQQIGVTDNAMELLERLCATDGFITLAEKKEMELEAAAEYEPPMSPTLGN